MLFPAQIKYDLEIIIRCIKNTTTKGLLSAEEEDLYGQYVDKILKFVTWRQEKWWHPPYVYSLLKFQEDAFHDLGPFELPNTTQIKFLRQKLTDLKQLIHLLCDPQTGRYKNIPLPKIVIDHKTLKPKSIYCRFDQQVDCLLKQKQNYVWRAKNPRKGALNAQANNFRDCQRVSWEKTSLKGLNLKDIDFKKLKHLNLKDVDKYSLYPVLNNINIKNIDSITLNECNITELNNAFFEILPQHLTYLSLQNNDITFISNSISKLTNLSELNLMSNQNLTDLPWECLSSRLMSINLKHTNVSQISSEIAKCIDLENLAISSDKLKYVPWNSLSSNVKILEIKSSRKKINKVELKEKVNLRKLDINNAGLEEINCLDLPNKIQDLRLSSNKLRTFDFLSNDMLRLSTLALNGNKLTSISWENLPSNLCVLYLNNNELTSIGDISHLTKLTKLSATSNKINKISECICSLKFLKWIILNANELSSLPENFKNMPILEELFLENNHFDYNTSNLEEVLWNRLPQTIQDLNLSQNTLGYLPCNLLNHYILSLHVEDCKLFHICPYLYTKAQKMGILIKKAADKPPMDLTIMLITENEKFRDTSKFPTEETKPIYYFNKIENLSKNLFCTCCAMCGENSEEDQFEQVMVMDFIIQYLEKKNFNSRYYGSGKWKTKVKSRLCIQCKEKLIETIDKAFEEHKNLKKKLEEKKAAFSKKKKVESTLKINESLNDNEYNDKLAEDKLFRSRKQHFKTKHTNDVIVIPRDETLQIDANQMYSAANLSQSSSVQQGYRDIANYNSMYSNEYYDFHQQTGYQDSYQQPMVTINEQPLIQTFGANESQHHSHLTPMIPDGVPLLPPIYSFINLDKNDETNPQSFYTMPHQPNTQEQLVNLSTTNIADNVNTDRPDVENIILLNPEGTYLATIPAISMEPSNDRFETSGNNLHANYFISDLNGQSSTFPNTSYSNTLSQNYYFPEQQIEGYQSFTGLSPYGGNQPQLSEAQFHQHQPFENVLQIPPQDFIPFFGYQQGSNILDPGNY